jgi:hypothetical protein
VGDYNFCKEKKRKKVKEREREEKSDNTIYKQAGLHHLYKEKLRGKK